MSWGFVQATGVEATGSGVTSLSKAFGSNCTAGNFLVLGAADYGMGASPTGTDTLSNTYAKAIQSGSASESAAILSAHCALSGANTVTYHPTSGTVYPGIAIAEFSGGGSVTTDNTNTGATGGGTTKTWNSVTVSGTDLIIAVMQTGVAAAYPYTAGGGTTLGYGGQYTSGSEGIALLYALNAVATASPAITNSSSENPLDFCRGVIQGGCGRGRHIAVLPRHHGPDAAPSRTPRRSIYRALLLN